MSFLNRSGTIDSFPRSGFGRAALTSGRLYARKRTEPATRFRPPVTILPQPIAQSRQPMIAGIIEPLTSSTDAPITSWRVPSARQSLRDNHLSERAIAPRDRAQLAAISIGLPPSRLQAEAADVQELE